MSYEYSKRIRAQLLKFPVLKINERIKSEELLTLNFLTLNCAIRRTVVSGRLELPTSTLSV